ncbi:hypothetical protein N8J89_08140 [Crossiella sp. CA-258035]|uniref:hypothetical protein n=1 Tax=Crossiella sp. CA-258035 TaxID=2981138 RepID=UPI0024BD5B3C|nr:hypothetical protein [Crossiella sp. CA-258035]WHT21025.1 hypothetical protein N8J89_08140 [Crossiella sp. CA-258035]
MTVFALAARSWAGGYIVPITTGTVTATAQAAQGRVKIDISWASSQYLNVYRIQDGVATPVRGAFPSPDPATVQTVYDYEAPLDVAVSYKVTTPWLAFAALFSSSVTLVSSGLSWLTHPTSVQLAMNPLVAEQPEREHSLDQAVLTPIGRRYPVVISAAVRQAPSQDLILYTKTLTERTQLLALVQSGSPLLLRTPASYGWDPLTWLSVGNVVERPVRWLANEPARVWSLATQQVDAPAVSGG